MDPRLDGVIFRGEPERVEAHRLEHVKALHLLEAGKSVGRAVVVPMPDVQLRARRIGKHFQHIIFVIRVLFVEVVFLGLFPALLPFAFDRSHIHNI